MAAKGVILSDTFQDIVNGGNWNKTQTGQGLLRALHLVFRNKTSSQQLTDPEIWKILLKFYIDGEGTESTNLPLWMFFGGYIYPTVTGTLAATGDLWAPNRVIRSSADANYDYYEFQRVDLRLPYDTSFKIEIENTNAAASEDIHLLSLDAEFAQF